MKKIAIVHHVGVLGGGTKSLLDMATMLCHNYDVTICVPKRKKLELECSNDNIHVKQMSCVPYLNLYSGCSPLISKDSFLSLKSILNSDKFCKEIEELNPDLILFNTIVAAVSSLKLNGWKCAVIDRETMTNNLHIWLYNKILNKNIKGAAFLCEYERNKFQLKQDVITEIIPDCVSQIDLKKADTQLGKLPEKKYKVLFMGGASLLKGAHTALKATSLLSDGVMMVIAGRFDSHIFSLKNIVKHLYNLKYCKLLIELRLSYKKVKNNANTLFVGVQPNIYPLIKQCDVIIFPSYKVHQPRPCIEAGYFSKPVILSDYKETEEYFIKGYNALMFKPNDADDLARCINYAAEHRKEMNKMGANNYDISMRLHDYDKTKKVLNDFVRRIIDRDYHL